MKKILAPSYTSFYLFIVLLGVLHFLYFQELRQTMPRIPGLKSILPFILFSILLLNFSKNIKVNLNKVSILFFTLFFYLIVYNIFYHFNYVILTQNISDSILAKNMMVLYGYLMYFLIGFYYQGYMQFKRSMYILYSILVINALIAMDLTTFVLSMNGLNLDIFDMYLFLGDSLAMISIVVIVLIESKYLQFFLFLLSTIAIYTLMSRTSLYIFVFSMMIYFFLKNKRQFLIYLMVMAGIIFLVILGNQELFDTLADSRMLGFLFGQEDASVNARNLYLEVGLDGIKNHWFEGDFGGGTLYFGKTGQYIHNYLGLFRQYGLLAFTLFILLCLFVLKDMFLWIINIKYFSSDYDVFIVLTIFILVEIIIGRGTNVPYIFFSIGVTAGIYKTNTWVKNKKIRTGKR